MITVIRFFKKHLARRDSKWFVIIFKKSAFIFLSCIGLIHPTPSHPLFFILMLFSHLHIRLPFRFSQSICTCAFRNSTCTLHAPLFPPFLISSFEYWPFNRTHYKAPHYALFLVLFLLILKSEYSDHFALECPTMPAFFFFGGGGRDIEFHIHVDRINLEICLFWSKFCFLCLL